MNIPWHRFLKIGLQRVFAGSCFEVQDEFDLSDPKQLVDFVVIRRADLNLPDPNPSRMPDGFQELKDHNLVTYKSMNEAFDRFALNELVGHAVAYSKLQAKSKWKSFSDELGLIAISTRQPSTEVIASLLHRAEAEDVYQIDCAGWQVCCVVINQAPPDDRNWLWELMRGDRKRWKNESLSTILQLIEPHLKNMETLDPEIEAFENEIIESWLEELTTDKKLFRIFLKTPTGKRFLRSQLEQGIEQGEEKIVIRLAISRFPKLTREHEKRIKKLSSSQLENLAVELSSFDDLEDLDSWLSENG